VGVAQMRRLEYVLALRRARAARYTQALKGVPHVLPPCVPEYATPNWQSYAIRIADESPVSRDVVAQRLLDAGIACRPAYMACHVQPAYRANRPPSALPNTE